jgi:hypothetical protein
LKIRLVALAGLVALAAVPPAAMALPQHADEQAVEHTHGPDSKALDRRGRSPAAAPYEVDAHSPWAASEYDGQAFTTDRADLTSLPTVHAVYLYPSNAPNRFLQFAAMFQADARQASSLLATSYERGVRFDERARVGGEGTVLDITLVRSSFR